MDRPRYRRTTLLGRGGMAEVHAGIDVWLGRPVAIKQLRDDQVCNPQVRARFRREAAAAARLNHPRIVAVFDAAQERSSTARSDVPIIVMELVDGQSLREKLRDGVRLQPDRALGITADILDALTASHAAGIVHRDIKPANVLLTSTGDVKVADFGIARSVSDDSATTTQTATVMGTAHYMSPEQARGLPVDCRSDLYSVGCLLYELLVGRPPFTGDSALSVTFQQVTALPSRPSSHDPRIPADVDALVLAALAKEPADRYQSAREMRTAVEQVRAGRPLPDAPAAAAPGTGQHAGPSAPRPPLTSPRGSRTRRWLLAAALTLLMIIGSGSAAYVHTMRGASPAAALVPSLIGLSPARAESVLDGIGLRARVHRSAEPSTAQQVVTAQAPAPGSARPIGTWVILDVNAPAGQASIPRGLLGRPLHQVEKILSTAGFTDVTAYPVAAAAGGRAGRVTAVHPGEGQPVSTGFPIVVMYATAAAPSGEAGSTARQPSGETVVAGRSTSSGGEGRRRATGQDKTSGSQRIGKRTSSAAKRSNAANRQDPRARSQPKKARGHAPRTSATKG